MKAGYCVYRERNMIVAEFTLDHPILRETLAENPETTVFHERSNAVDGERVRILLWAEGGDLDEFESVMDDDPTVQSPICVTDLETRRLYQTELTDEGLHTSVYPMLVEENGVNHELVATSEGWQFRTSFPNHASFERFHDFCRERDIGFELHRLHERRESEASDSGEAFGLTTEQLDALVVAMEIGYFQIPRENSLEEVADRLGISANAASHRLRRGLNTLLQNTVGEK